MEMCSAFKSAEALKHDSYWILRKLGARHLPTLAAAVLWAKGLWNTRVN